MKNDCSPAYQSFLISDWCRGILFLMSDLTKSAAKGVISSPVDEK